MQDYMDDRFNVVNYTDESKEIEDMVDDRDTGYGHQRTIPNIFFRRSQDVSKYILNPLSKAISVNDMLYCTYIYNTFYDMQNLIRIYSPEDASDFPTKEVMRLCGKKSEAASQWVLHLPEKDIEEHWQTIISETYSVDLVKCGMSLGWKVKKPLEMMLSIQSVKKYFEEFCNLLAAYQPEDCIETWTKYKDHPLMSHLVQESCKLSYTYAYAEYFKIFKDVKSHRIYELLMRHTVNLDLSNPNIAKHKIFRDLLLNSTNQTTKQRWCLEMIDARLLQLKLTLLDTLETFVGKEVICHIICPLVDINVE